MKQESKRFAVVVNDDPTQLAMLSGLVAKSGLEPRPFSGAEAALAAMDSNNPPVLIVTDLYMPVIDGWRFCRLLHSPEYAAFNQIPIVVVSATFAGDQPDRIAADLGAKAFLTSPVDGRLFAEHVRAILNGEQVKTPQRVLIVEDSTTLCGTLKKAFTANGYEADTALTAQAASEAFSRTPYDIAVLDYHLPDGNGDGLLVEFRQQRPDCVCLMMTTDPDPTLALAWMKKGASAYLRKPFTPEYLIELCAKTRRERALLRAQDLLEVRTRELRESEGKYRLLTESIKDVVWVEDVEAQRFLYISPSVEKLRGYTPEEVMAEPVINAVIPEARMYVSNLIHGRTDAFLSGKEPADKFYTDEAEMTCKDGSTVWTEVVTGFYKNPKNGRVEVRGVIRDITERKHTEAVQAFLAQTSYMAGGEPFFNALARYLAQSLGMDFVCIDVPEVEGLTARTLAVWCDGKFEDNVTYALKDTPCGDVVGKAVCCFPASVSQLFPRDQVLQDMRAESYVGVTLWGHTGKPIGLIAVIGRKPLENRPQAEAILKLVAIRAAGELERLENEDALREAEWKFRALFEKGPIGVAYHKMIYDASGKSVDYFFLDANETYQKLTGVDPRGKLVTQAFPGIEKDPFDWIGKFGKVALTGETIRFESYLQANDQWYDAVGYQYKPDHFVAAFVNITERKKADDALMAANARLHALWNVSSLANADLKVVSDHILETLAKMTGSDLGFYGFINEDESVMTIHSWAGAAMKDCVMVDKPQQFRISEAGVWAEAVRHRKPLLLNSYRDAHPAKKGLPQGHTPLTSLLVVPFLVNGRVSALAAVANRAAAYDQDDVQQINSFLSTIQAIVDNKLAQEREKELREKLERAARMESLGVLAGGVAHDLNNVLGPIVLLPEMVGEYIERCGNPSDPEYADTIDALQAITASALRATAMVSDLVVMGRRGQFQHAPVDVNKMVTQLIDSKQIKDLQIRHLGVKVSKQLSEDSLWCQGSDSRLARVLANLVGNAAEAIDGQGDIVVTTGRQVLTELQHGYEDVPAGDYVTIEVTDTGCGMDAKTLARMFEPFYSTKAPGQRSGSGLGLSVVNGLVKDHAGFLDVKSESGKGTTFTVYLPFAAAGEIAVVNDRAHMPGGNERVLVVDDEPNQQFLAQRALKKLGYGTTAVSSGEEAVALFEAVVRDGKPPFDIVLMDMLMKGMDGLTACKAILKLFPKQKMLIVSGHAPDNLVAETKVLGLDWLSKPYKATELARAVRAGLDG